MKKIIMILACIFLLTGCNQKENETPKEEIKKEEQAIILDDQVINNLTFESFNMATDSNNITHIYLEATNKTENTINVSKITYKLFVDENELVNFTEYVTDSIEAGETIVITDSVDLNLSKVNRVEYVVE